ncbi:MAG: ACP S-malonyltransferase [Gammaproteobacteria bacterium]|nr:ACP S-malonyltransferase [Gammaproteobacteria bacterium]
MSDPAQHVLFLFPGQGSQYRGMGSDLHAEFDCVRKVYDTASEVLGYDLADLAFRDPDGTLDLTRFTQPAILTHSIACLEAFRERTDGRLQPTLAGGHSLGEYSALVAAGALDFADAVRLVQQRGELMGTHGEGEMTAFPIELDAIRPLAERHFCAVAGCNLPDQTVVGGRSADLEALEQEVTEAFPRKRPVRLKTEGAFHTYYMVEAARRFREVLDGASFALGDVRVLANFTGGFHDPDPVAVRSRLFFQLFHPVMWHANLQSALAEGVATMVEFGGGIGKGETPEEKRPNLEGMVKKTLRGTDFEIAYHAVISTASLADAEAAFAG